MFYLDKSICIVFGMGIGLISIFLGYKLFIKGIDGSSSFDGEVQKIKLSLRNASPGLFFALFGSFIVISGVYKKEIHSEVKYNNGEITSRNYSEKGELNQDFNRLFNLAVKLKNLGNTDDSKLIYESILLIDETNSDVYNNLALMMLDQGDLNESLSLAEKALKYSQESNHLSNYFDTLAKIHLALGDKKKSRSYIDKALELEPENSNYIDFKEALNL